MKILPVNVFNGRYRKIQKINNHHTNYQDINNSYNNFPYGNISFGQLYSASQVTDIKRIKNLLLNKNSSQESVGIYGPDSLAKQGIIKDFIQEFDDSGIRIKRIDFSNQDTRFNLDKQIQEAERIYTNADENTLIYTENIDASHDKFVLRNLKKLEHSKQKGIIWIWSAKDKDKVDPSLLRRTNDLILVQPSTEDNKKTWLEYLALLDKMPKTNRQAKLMSEALRVMPKVFPIKLSVLISSGLEILKLSLKSQPDKPKNDNGLSAYQMGLSQAINHLSEVGKLDYKVLNSIDINGTALPDFWLTLEGKNPNDYTQRTKEKEIHQILSDKEMTAELISRTLDELQKTNSMIDSARRAYKDIIENENELTQEQKDILIKQQDSKLFFEVVTNDLDSSDEIQLELNAIKTLRQLSKEKETLRQNALNNIFNPVRNIDLEDEDSSETAGYILNLLSQKALVSNPQEKERIQKLVANFEDAINSGDEDRYKSLWQELVDVAQEYFESRGLDDITDRNITLLNSINKNIQDENNPRILSLIKNPSLTIEQKEFVSRYKDDINFRRMISNPNIDVESTIEELVYFEAGNRDLIDNNNLDISYKKIMSDKFHEIDSNAKDINIQGYKISNKLDEINSTIKEQNGLISDFANNFATYADSSLTLQSNQLQELISINQNTFEIKQYTQALTRSKLTELERDKYYKDIVPEITKLLPDDEQIDLNEFLTKIDELAKHEKDDKRRKKLIKAGLIIAGTIAAGALVYYAGPTVVAHLASKLPAQAALKAATSTATKVGLARSVGNSGLMKQVSFGHYSSDPTVLQNEIDDLKREIKHAIEMANHGGSDASYWTKKVSELTKELTQHQKWLAEALKKIKSSI